MGSHGLNAEELPDRRAEHGTTVPKPGNIMVILTFTKFVIITIVYIIIMIIITIFTMTIIITTWSMGFVHFPSAAAPSAGPSCW